MEIFETLLKISLTAIPIIGMIYLVRTTVGKHMPKSFNYVLWFILIIRLALPVNLQSVVSVFNILPEQPEITFVRPTFEQNSAGSQTIDHSYSDATVHPEQAPFVYNDARFVQDVSQPVKEVADIMEKPPVIMLSQILVLIWLTGIVVMSACHLAAYCRLKRKIHLNTANYEMPSFGKRVTVTVCTNFDLPFTVGLFRQIIVIPQHVLDKIEKDELNMILHHELTHLARRDHLALYAALVLRCVYWFNPFIHLAFNTMKSDQEIACDASVINNFEQNEKQCYASALLSVAKIQRQKLAPAALGFARNGLKRRVTEIMKKSKYKRFKLIAAPVIIILLSAVMLTEALAVSADDIFMNYDRIPESPEISTGHRPGFKEADIEFTGIDPEAKYIGVRQDELDVTNYDVAQYGLRELYDITGYQVEECFVKYNEFSSVWFDYYFSPENEYTFLRYAVDSSLRSMGFLEDYNMICIGYSSGTMASETHEDLHSTAEALQAGNTMLIPMDNIVRPENIDSMSIGDIAKWYYENSTFGNRQEIVRTEYAPNVTGWDDGEISHTEVKLFLDNGDYYRIWLDNENYLIEGMFGPYAQDVEPSEVRVNPAKFDNGDHYRIWVDNANHLAKDIFDSVTSGE